MSSFKPQHQEPLAIGRRHGSRRRVIAVVGAAAVVAIAIGATIGMSVAGQDTTAPSASTGRHDGELPAGYRLTGEVSPMGGPVIETPGTRGGAATAGGITVTDGADIAMGRVPLAYAVNPTWHLRNTTDRPVTLGRPKVAVVRGCCPAEPMLGTTTLAPGQATTLEFPTQMHPGMDGDHLFRLTVPVGTSGDALTLSLAGDFS